MFRAVLDCGIIMEHSGAYKKFFRNAKSEANFYGCSGRLYVVGSDGIEHLVRSFGKNF